MKKKAITLIACTDTYESLCTFSTIEELNQSIYNHITRHTAKLSETMVTILKLIGRYSVKYLGVSFLTKNKIGELVGKSRRTIIRICHELEELGIIKQYPMKRSSDQQQTSNAIIIQPYLETVKNEHVTQETLENVTPITNSSPLNNLQDLKTYKGPILFPYESFREMCHCFTKEKQTVNRLYGVYLCQIKPIKPFFNEKELLDLGILAIKITFQATKRKKINNIFGYYNGVLDQLFTKLYFEDMKTNYWCVEERNVS
jgi:DNA-binding Lrp family transcriptional regulator